MTFVVALLPPDDSLTAPAIMEMQRSIATAVWIDSLTVGLDSACRDQNQFQQREISDFMLWFERMDLLYVFVYL